MNKEILIEDYRYIEMKNIHWNRFEDKTILVTGATGLIGSLICKFFSYLKKEKKINLTIVALVRNIDKATAILGEEDVDLFEEDIRNLSNIPGQIDYIFHCAAITRSKEMVENPVQVIEVIVNGTQNVMELAKAKNAESVVYLSSMEIYGKQSTMIEKVNEEHIGYVNIFNERNSYPISKRMAENICYCYHKQYNVPVKVARLAQTFGAGVLEEENRVFMQFAKSVLNDKDIVLNTKGESETNCCYTADILWGLIILLLQGENGQVYNVANEENHMTIMEMAQLVANQVAEGRIRVQVKTNLYNQHMYPEPVKLHLDTKKIEALGWKPQIGIKEMYRRMIAYIGE